MFKKSGFIIFIFWCTIVIGANAQQKPVGKFLKDKIKIGEPVQYALSIKYPIKKEAIFPDSTYSFAPFEFIEKKYFKTVSDSINSFDSVVYTLSTFETDTIQRLSLPVFFINDDDTTNIFADEASIRLEQTVITLPDSVKLIENTTYVNVKKEFNSSYWFIGIAVFLLLVILSILIFGKTFFKTLKLRKLEKQHQKFLKVYNQLTNDVNEANFGTQLLNIYAVWKKYIQDLTDRPYTTYSTKEITAIIKDDHLKMSLISIDRGIYAGKFSQNINADLKVLASYAQKFYNQKVMEVKHGARK